MALEDGTTLEAALWESVKGLLRKAADGDLDAMRLAFKWLVRYELDGEEPRANAGGAGGGANAGVVLNFGGGVAGGSGPKLPPDLEAYYAELEAIEAEHGARRLEITGTSAIDDLLA